MKHGSRFSIALAALVGGVAGSITGCVPEAPARVVSGLDQSRALASLDDEEVLALCEAWEDYANAAAQPDDLDERACESLAVHFAATPEACEERRASCLAEAGGSFCEGTHAVPTCDPSSTLGALEACATTEIDARTSVHYDCSMAGDAAAIAAIDATVTITPECLALLGDPACNLWAPPVAD